MKVKFEAGTGAFLLFLVFLVLRLASVVHWSWWLVCLPLYAGAGLVLAVLVALAVAVVVALVVALVVTSAEPKAKARSRW